MAPERKTGNFSGDVIFLDESYFISVSGQALNLILVCSMPMLLPALVVGLFISIIQATTQIQEQTLSFVPKLVVTFVAMMISGMWIADLVGSYTISIFEYMPNLAGGP